LDNVMPSAAAWFTLLVDTALVLHSWEKTTAN